MMNLVERSLGPPGGWHYTQPESGREFKCISYRQLIDQVGSHRRGNGYDVAGGWEQRFENEFCVQNRLEGTPWCPLDYKIEKPERRLGVADVRRFLKTVQKAVEERGDIFVEQGQAEDRAATCVGCVNNAHVPGCFGCNGVRGLIDKVRNGRATSHDENLRHCTVCGCSNQVKVWLKDSIIESEDLEFPDHCWLKRADVAAEPAS